MKFNNMPKKTKLDTIYALNMQFRKISIFK